MSAGRDTLRQARGQLHAFIQYKQAIFSCWKPLIDRRNSDLCESLLEILRETVTRVLKSLRATSGFI
jgi:hypothetical protein